MNNRKFVFSLSLSIFVAACGVLPPAPAAQPAATQGAAAPAAVPPAEANATTTTIPLPQQPLPQPSLIVPGTAAPLPFIGNSASPLASPNGVSLNCRGGPELRWPVGDVLDPGEIVQVVGKNTDGTWLLVNDPAAPLGNCWISAAFATVTGDVSGLQIVVVTGIPMINGTPVGMIVRVQIELDPTEIDIPGCVGPAPTIHIAAKIHVDGPMDIYFHFEGDDIPNLRRHHYGFDGPDIDDVADSFTPPLNAGKHSVFIAVDGMDLSGTGNLAFYTIKC